MLQSIKITSFSDIKNSKGIDFTIPEAGEIVVLSGKNGTGKTSFLKLINIGCSGKGFGYSGSLVKSCEGDLNDINISFTYLKEGIKEEIEIRRGAWEDRYDYTKIISDTLKHKVRSEHFTALSSGITCDFMLAVGSRKTNLLDEMGTTKRAPIEKKVNQSIVTVLGSNAKPISIEQPKKGVSPKKKAKEGGKTVHEMFLGQRALAELFSAIYSLNTGDLFMIDEIEQALHFDIHEPLLKEVSRIAKEKNIRIILTTHSPYIFDATPNTQRYLLKKNPKTKEIEIEMGATLHSKQEIGLHKKRTIYVVEDIRAKKIFEKSFLIKHKDMPHIFIGGGGKELFGRIDGLQDLFKDDEFIAVFDPDISNDEIAELLKKLGDHKYEILSMQGYEGKTPERILLEFAFTKTQRFIESKIIDEILADPKTDLIPFIKSLQNGSSISGKSEKYKTLYTKLIMNSDKEDSLLTAFMAT